MSKETSAPQEQSPPKELNSLQEAIEYAIRLQRNNQLEASESLYRRILEAVPNQSDALHFLGLIRYQRGRADEAIPMIYQAIRQEPGFPDYYNNLGNIHLAVDQKDEALTCYKCGLEVAPDNANLLNNLGVFHRIQGEMELAEAAFKRAIEVDQKHVLAHNNMGILHSRQGEIRLAEKYYRASIALDPKHPDAYKLLGLAFGYEGRVKEATEVYRNWMTEQPDNPVARHHYAACSGQEVPARAGDDYIVESFDAFANSFEEQLKLRLSYKAPELVVAAIEKYLPPPENKLAILDAGCGTGLCGPLIVAHAKKLTGVDLSEGMLRKAEGKQCYDELIKVELTAFLGAAEHSATWDVILSADTLCYFGPLDELFEAARRGLRKKGLLVFSVEDGGETAKSVGHVLNYHGRYSHHEEYIRKSLEKAHFKVLSIDSDILRTEAEKPVAGLIVVAQVLE